MQPGRIHRWPWWWALVGAAATGVLLGGPNSLCNVLGSPYSPRALRPNEGVFTLEVLAAVLAMAWAWALVAFGLGWFSATKWRAASAGLLALSVASAVYYVSDYSFGLNDALSTGEMTYWIAISGAVGPASGLLGHLARRWQRWGILPGLAAPALVVVFTYRAGSDHIQPWPYVVAWILAVGLTIAVTWRWLLMQRRLRMVVP